jgi:hypothetical protein
MRIAILTFVGALLAMAVALLGYHFLIGVPQQERLVASVDRMAVQQEQVRRTLADAKESLAAADDRASLLMREDLRIAEGLKIALAEYYMSMGKLPATHAELGAPEPERHRGKSLRSARVLADGSIELVFDANSGVDGGRILLRADFSHADIGNIAWYCESADYPLVKRVSPACDYRPAGAHVAQT